jgi:pullulanase
MYGEGWTGGDSPMPADKLAYKWNSYQFGRVGLFNDNIRDSVKGGTFNAYDMGFVSGNRNTASIVRRGIAGSVPHWQIKDVPEACWAFEPTQSVNYCEAHDNNTLWDKLKMSARNYTEEAQMQMDKLAAAIIILSQGMPFIQLGQDFLRSKPRILDEGEVPDDINIYSHNSYNAPDYTNSVKWDRKNSYRAVFEYYKALIKLRKSSRLFRLSTKQEVETHLYFMDTGDGNFIVCKLEDENQCFVVAFNPYSENKYFNLPEGNFYIRLDKNGMQIDKSIEHTAYCPALSTVVFERRK